MYPTLVKVYGPHSVQGNVGMGNVVASEGMGPSDVELRYLRLAHFDFVIWDAKVKAVAAWEYDGVHHITDPKQQRRDRLKDSICGKAGLPVLVEQYIRSTISHSKSITALGDCPESEKPVTAGTDGNIRPAQPYWLSLSRIR